MKIAQHLSRRGENAHARRRQMLRVVGATSCLVAIFISAGAHWAVLQSIAYTRMLVEFAQQDSWCTAVKKTFDEHYACPLCPKIREGCNKERKIPELVNGDRTPEFLVESSGFIFLRPAIVADVAVVLSAHIQFSNAPPKPPPRMA